MTRHSAVVKHLRGIFFCSWKAKQKEQQKQKQIPVVRYADALPFF
jgi:hypothetical protein